MSDDDALGALCLKHLANLVPDVERRSLGCQIVRVPLAYPIFLRRYESERVALADSTGIDGLVSIGRNGEFDHILMEDVYWRTVRKIGAWLRPTMITVGVPWPGMYALDVSATSRRSCLTRNSVTSFVPNSRFMNELLVI